MFSRGRSSELSEYLRLPLPIPQKGPPVREMTGLLLVSLPVPTRVPLIRYSLCCLWGHIVWSLAQPVGPTRGQAVPRSAWATDGLHLHGQKLSLPLLFTKDTALSVLVHPPHPRAVAPHAGMFQARHTLSVVHSNLTKWIPPAFLLPR